jgi:rhamnulokinase
VLAGPADATVLGNVLAQVRASGEILSLQDLRNVVSHSCVLRDSEPDPAVEDQWLEARSRFTGLLTRP